jgi:hypothetical protein
MSRKTNTNDDFAAAVASLVSNGGAGNNNDDGDVKRMSSALESIKDDGVDMERLRAQELNEMDVHDRNTILNEIHGVDNRALQETPELISDSLLELQKQMEPLLADRPRLKTSFIFREEYAIRFLRREFFDVPKAATRMVKNLEYLEAFFGPETLSRNLTLQDLGKEETKLLKEGCLQVLPSRDRVGRRIIAWVGNYGLGYSMKACVRVHRRLQTKLLFVILLIMIHHQLIMIYLLCFFIPFHQQTRVILYVYFSVSEDVDTQRKGVVELVIVPNPQKMFESFVDAHKTAQASLSDRREAETTAAAAIDTNDIDTNEESQELHQSRKNAPADWLEATVLRSSGIHLCLPPFHPIATYMFKQVFLMREYNHGGLSL